MASPAFGSPAVNYATMQNYRYDQPNDFATLQNQNPNNESQMQGGGSGSGSATIPTFELPPWLTKNPDDLMGELTKQYGATSQYFNPAGIAGAYNRSINTAMGMGGQIAQNAALEGIARAGQEGGGVNSAMLKAQAMLPVYEHTAKLRNERAMAVADVKQREAAMRGQLASTLGQMRMSYLNALGDTYMRGRGMNMQWEQSQQQLAKSGGGGGGGGGLSRAELARLQASKGGGPGIPMTPGYIPSFGPITPMTIGGVAQPGTVAVQYPMNRMYNY